MVGAGATTGGTMDLANLIKPILTEGEVRLMGSTTFEEFKHVERDRALARRVQRIDVDEPNEGDTVRILQRPARALRGVPPGHLHRTTRWRRRPAWPAGTCATCACPTARSTCSTRRGPASASTRREDGQRVVGRAGGRAGGGAHGPHPGVAGLEQRPGAPAHARGGAEARGLRPGGSGGHGGRGDQARARGPRAPGAPRGLVPVHRPHRRRARRSWPSSSPGTWATSSTATT